MSEQTNKKKNKKILIILVCIAAIIAMAVVLWLAYLESEPLSVKAGWMVYTPVSTENVDDFLQLERELAELSPLARIFFHIRTK